VSLAFCGGGRSRVVTGHGLFHLYTTPWSTATVLTPHMHHGTPCGALCRPVSQFLEVEGSVAGPAGRNDAVQLIASASQIRILLLAITRTVSNDYGCIRSTLIAAGSGVLGTVILLGCLQIRHQRWILPGWRPAWGMSVYDQVSGQPAVYELHQLLAVSEDEKGGRGANAHTASGPETRESVEAGCTSSDLLRLVNGPCGNPNRTQVLNGPFSWLGHREFGMVSLMWCSTNEVGWRCLVLGFSPWWFGAGFFCSLRGLVVCLI
jgi:hypothetical protein